MPNTYEYEFIIIPKVCISDDTSSALWHHVPHFRPITYPTHCPSHSSGGRASDSRYPPLPRLYEEPGFETLRRSIYYSLLTGMVYSRGSDLSQLKSVSAIKKNHANIYGKKYS